LREIEVLSFGTIAELAERLPLRSRYFQFLLAWDAPDKTPQQLMSFFRPLVERGLVYFCAWGGNCEAVHGAVDRCDIERRPETRHADYIMMTTWHSDESLEEALWFFKVCALPRESIDPSECDRFSVAIGSSAWSIEMKKALKSIEGDADDEIEPVECDTDEI
jgi:hypothetical protein